MPTSGTAFTNADTYPGKAAVLAGALRRPSAATRPPSSGPRAWRAETPTPLVPTPRRWPRLGVTLMTVGCDGPDYDLGPAQALVRWRDSRSTG